jgi:hypothetical protein
MIVQRVERYSIDESNGIVSVPVWDSNGKRQMLQFSMKAASDIQGGLVQFHEAYGIRYRAEKAAKAKRMIAAGAERADVIEQLDILSDSWLTRALRGAFDLVTEGARS